jgi:opacity protein-like surface antigen
VGLAAILSTAASLQPVLAEDADRFRPYLRFHSGDIDPLWGVDDLWSFGLGANFNRQLGVELALDFFERDFEDSGGALGEVSAWNFIPELRLRQPLFHSRLVPYLVAGAGPTFLQFNDRKQSGKVVDIQGTTLTVSVGVGLEYFIADNVTFGIEGKYFWMDPIQGNVDAVSKEVDLSSPTFTFGLRIYFDQNHPRPPASQDRPASMRFYAGVRFGGSVLTDDHWISGVGLKPEPSAWGGTLNQVGTLALGLDWSRHWGVELAADSLEHRIHVEGIGSVGEYGMGTVIPYFRYRYPLGSGRWAPYLMAGVGLAYAEFNDANPDLVDLRVEGKGIYPALGAGGGVEYFLTRNFSLNLEARWVYTWGHELEVGNYHGKGDFSSALFGFGFRVYLGEASSSSGS